MTFFNHQPKDKACLHLFQLVNIGQRTSEFNNLNQHHSFKVYSFIGYLILIKQFLFHRFISSHKSGLIPVLASVFFGVHICVYVYILNVNANLGQCSFFGGNFSQVLNLKNMISTARKNFGEKMTLIHHMSKYIQLEYLQQVPSSSKNP